MTRSELAATSKRPHSRSRARCRGSETIEFTLALLPLLMLTFLLLDVSWLIFIKSTLQQAVRAGCRFGITNLVPNGSDLTTEIKNKVQSSALGFLNGASGRVKIHVHYWQPPDPGCTTACTATDVSASPVGNAGGNVVIVSVDNYSVIPLLPRIFSWNKAADQSPTQFSVASADRIEPWRGTPPPIGAAP